MRFVILAALLVLNTTSVPEFPPKTSAPASQVAVVIILDISNSMEGNDPNGLRFTGARLFSSLLEPGDSAGVILFSTQSSALTDGLTVIQNERDKAALLKRIQDRPSNGYTDVKSAFLSARELLRQADLSGQAAYIVFLTDGKPEIENMYPSYEAETLDVAKSLNVPVLSIALASSAQTPFLDRLARETGGRVITADDASDLLDAYLSIFGQIKDRTVLAASAGDPSFLLDPGLAPYINSMSFVMSRPANVPVRLDSPAGAPVQPDGQNVYFYFEDPDFITISLVNPPPGKWAFQGPTGQEFKAYAILHSRLRIEMISPGAYYQQSKPMEIAVQMTEELLDGSRAPIIGDATFTAVVTPPDATQESLDLFYDDGTHGDALAGDGIFSRLYVNASQAGTYTIQIHGHKADVPVDYLAGVEVIPFPEIVIQQPVDRQEFDGEPLPVSVLLKDAGDFSLESGDLIVAFRSPSGMRSEISLVKQGEIYSGSFVPAEEGPYQVQVMGRNAVYRGLPYEETLTSQFEVKFVRTLNIDAGKWVTNGCFDPRGKVPVRLRVFSPEAEIIEFNISGVDGLQVYPASIRAKGGAEEFLVDVRTPSGLLSPGTYQFHLEGESPSDSEFEQGPLPATFAFQVPGVYQRCDSVFRWGGLSGFVLAIAVLFITRKIRLDAMPVLLSGTLRYWRENDSGSSPAQEHDLNLFSKSTILVGKASDCDIRISDHILQDRHFALTAEKKDDGTQVVLQPVGEIWKGYSQLHVPITLHHGDIFRIENLNFQYLSDSGE